MEFMKKLQAKDHFTERESKIADYIIHNCEKVLDMTTRQLASETYTSATVIVRFVRKLGYQGFNDFKIHLLTDLKENSYSEIEVEKKESLISIVNKVSSFHEKVLLETKNRLSIDDLEKIQEALEQVNQIDIFALDANASIGEYVSHNIMQAGKLSNVYRSMNKILLYESLVEKSVVIVISRMGKDKNLLKAVQSLRKKGHFVILMTSNEDSLLVKNADVSLLCRYKENVVELGDLLFYFFVSYIFDVLISIIVKNNYDKAIDLYRLHDQLYEYKFTVFHLLNPFCLKV